MTLAGKEAVRRAFHTKAEQALDAIIQEFVAVRVDGIFDVGCIDDVESSCLTRDTVRRAYVQGLKDANRTTDPCNPSSAPTGAYIDTLLRSLLNKLPQQYVTDEDRELIRQSVWEGYRTGQAEGRIPLCAVI